MKPANKKARRKAYLSFDFNQVARKALRDHPELKKKDVLFVDVANDRYIATARTLARLGDDDDAQEELDETIKQSRKEKTSFAQLIPVNTAGKSIHAIVFHPDRHTLFSKHDRNIDNIATLDHELAHVLAPCSNRAHSENIADAYAILRHLQRYDGQDTDIAYSAWKRAMVFIMSGKQSHLTTFTIDQILIDRASADFISLTPQQTAAIAREYGHKHARSQNNLDTLSDAFSSARSKHASHDTFRKIAQVTLAADVQSDTFHLGARALLPVLQGQKMRLDGRNIVLPGAEWQSLHQQLLEKLATLSPSHPLRRVHGMRASSHGR